MTKARIQGIMTTGSRWNGFCDLGQGDKAMGERVVKEHRSTFMEFKVPSKDSVSRLDYPKRIDHILIAPDGNTITIKYIVPDGERKGEIWSTVRYERLHDNN
jgi:hypothetical protein